jgi:hypothetical protein
MCVASGLEVEDVGPGFADAESEPELQAGAIETSASAAINHTRCVRGSFITQSFSR